MYIHTHSEAACVAFHRCRLMILICIVLVVIGSLICALLKARTDERLEDSSMKRQWTLSLKRNRQQGNEAQVIHHDLIEISDDESFDSSSNALRNIKQNVTSREAVNVPNSVAGASAACNSKDVYNVSDDLSSDEDIDDVPDNAFNKSQSLFNWNKPFFADPLHQNSFPECSELKKVVPTEMPNKRQKLMSDPTSFDLNSSDDESIYHVTSEKDDSLPLIGIQHEKMIAGIKVKFPLKPYPCQIAVMNSLINGCTKEQNCLLESPTGSGKTLALLCGALAWQEHYREKMCREESYGMDTESPSYDALNDNFFLNPSQYIEEELHDKVSQKITSRRVPKIFYGSRTHTQIKQVVRELKKTAYKDKRMTILSSRNHTCIQKTNKNKNELCNELLDSPKDNSCLYYNEHSKKKATAFSYMTTPWDIEDLVSKGESIGACPYFGARSLMAQAEIIFCPYNYILDPNIRDSMQINLKDNIVILDEAHNVEDICRSTASVKLRDDEMTNAIKECKHLLHKGRNRFVYTTIQEYFTDFVKFLKFIEVKRDETSGNTNNNQMTKNWIGEEFRELLGVNNVGCSKFPDFLNASKVAIEDFNESKREDTSRSKKMTPTISRDTVKLLEHLCFSMQMIESDVFANDYRMYITETSEIVKKPAFFSEDVLVPPKQGKVRTLKLVCMNPAIIFAPLARAVRSVIVASGTLTPTMSFQSELGTQFPHIVNPNHIIPENQVYVRCIQQGPTNIRLNGTYKSANSWTFQDELGKLILQVCDAVPYGVLCFFSSYSIMNTIHKRWKSNDTWKKLSNLKKIFIETQDNEKMPEIMTAYRKVINESSSQSSRTACGAILFAVYRGKVAEGVDFSDNEARCVLVVSIPYLSPIDNEIQMKKQYNDLNKSKGLLPSREWSTVNAFRALNQALGRCVRHKGDWGAVLLVDESTDSEPSVINKHNKHCPRHLSKNYVNYLPKWIRTKKTLYDTNSDLEIELQNFVALQVARERGEKCEKN